jgi:hypothetical protein
MSDAPERIWADGNQEWDSGSWGLDKEFDDDVEYIRADLHRAEVEAAVKRAIEASINRAEKYTECCQSCAGVGRAIRALATDPAALERIIDGGRG